MRERERKREKERERKREKEREREREREDTSRREHILSRPLFAVYTILFIKIDIHIHV